MKIYFYKLTSDEGGAPCVANGILSLAICKPRIRASASPDDHDLIFGFLGKKTDEREPLIYIAEVDEKIKGGAYYRSNLFRNREDCIYEFRGSKFRIKPGALHHKDGSRIDKDLGPAINQEGFECRPKANVLLSKNFRYFGNKAYVLTSKLEFKHLKNFISKMRQGERVHNIECTVFEEALALKNMLWKEFSHKKIGKPTHREAVCQCGANSDLERHFTC